MKFNLVVINEINFWHACLSCERDEYIIIIIMNVIITMINNNGSLSKRIMMSGENGIYWLSLWNHLGIKRRGWSLEWWRLQSVVDHKQWKHEIRCLPIHSLVCPIMPYINLFSFCSLCIFSSSFWLGLYFWKTDKNHKIINVDKWKVRS